MAGGRRLVSIALVAVCLLPGRAPAEPEDQRELLLFAEPVVSAATKRPMSARAAPSSVTIVTRDQIDRYGWRTLAELLRSVRGFYTSNDRNYTYVGVRGFQRPSDYNDRLLLLVNGHTLNDDIYQNAPVDDQVGVDLEAIERVEIVRGPGSALYGGNPLFGVINLITRTGSTQPGVRALVETGSFGRKRTQASVGHVFENGADLFASGSILDVDGPHELYFPDYAAPQTNDGIARDADGEQAYSFFLHGQWKGFSLQGSANRREKHLPAGAFQTTFNDPTTKTVDERHFAELQYDGELAHALTVSSRVYYDGYNYSGTYVYGGGRRRIKNQDQAFSDWVGGEARLLWTPFQGHSITGGVEYSYHPRVRQFGYDLPTLYQTVDARQSYGAAGAYVQDEWSLCEQLTLTAGLRFDHVYGDVDEFTPRGGLVWTPQDGTTVKLLVGRSFRPPNLYERYYDYSDSGSQSLPNPELRPERILTYEAVVEQRLPANALGTVALYRYDLSGLIEQRESTRGGVALSRFENRSGAEAQGAEIELKMPFGRRGEGHVAYALQRTTADGRSLSNSPRHIGQVGVSQVLLPGLTAGAELIVTSPRRTLGGRLLETARIANVHLTWDTPLSGLTLTAGGYNLFDQTRPDPVGSEFRQDRIPQNGVTWRMQVRYAF